MRSAGEISVFIEDFVSVSCFDIIGYVGTLPLKVLSQL